MKKRLVSQGFRFGTNQIRRYRKLRYYLLFLLSLLSVNWPVTLHAEIKAQVTLGVLAHRGEQQAQQMWLPLTRYLSKELPIYEFVLRPLSLREMDQAVASDELDFILTNPGHYVNLEAGHGITRIATLKNMRQGQPYTAFGGVIFVRADRQDIVDLDDLKGKTFAGVSKGAFGGFQVAWRELKLAGIDPFTDFSRLDFVGFPQDDIVRQVRDGKVDAGTVRTDTLERMASKGEIDLADFRVLNVQQSTGFPFLHSTRLYPEWPFARARHTTDEMTTQVLITLFLLSPDHPVSKAGLNAGWTVPLSYQQIHDMFRELGIGPYARNEKITLQQIYQQYQHWLIVILFAFLVTLFSYFRGEKIIRTRTLELSDSNRALQQEIEHRTQSESETGEYRDHLQLLMDAIAEGIIGLDKTGHCTYANQNSLRLLGHDSEQDVLGKTLQEIANFGSASELGASDSEIPLSAEGDVADKVLNEIEYCFRKDGTLFVVEYWMHPLVRDGQVQGFVMTFIDITQRKQNEAELRRHREHLEELVDARTFELQQSNDELQSSITQLRDTQGKLVQAEKMAALGSLVAGFSHEINTPLGVGVTSASNIHEEIETLQQSFSRGEMKRSDLESFIQHVQQGSDILLRNLQRASELIRSFKQVAVDQSSDEWRMIDLREYIDEIILSLKPRWKRTQVELLNESDRNLTLYTHPGAIYQILSNMIINSLIYAFDEGQGGQIRISADKEDESVHLRFADNGKGIPREYHKKIFDPFFTTRRGQGGSGLGLNIVYNLVTGTLKGDIDFDSEADQGTVFHVRFPHHAENLNESG